MDSNKEILLKISRLEKEIASLKDTLEDRSAFTLMYMKKSGKHTFVLQPNAQKHNLLASGWIEYSKQQLDTYLKKYEW